MCHSIGARPYRAVKKALRFCDHPVIGVCTGASGEKHCPITAPEFSISAQAQADAATIEAGRLRVEVSVRPFSFTIRRDGRSLLRAGGAWVADGEIRDQFIQFTEGVIAGEPVPRRSGPATRSSCVRVSTASA